MKLKTLVAIILPNVLLSSGSFAGEYLYRAPVSNLNIGQWTTEYQFSEWENINTPYNCLSTIQPEDIYYNQIRNSDQTCMQKQARIRSTIQTSSLGETKTTQDYEEQVISISGDKVNVTGTHLESTCKNILEYDSSLTSATYKVKVSSGETIDVSCDMTTSGGGWTLVAQIYGLNSFSGSVSPGAIDSGSLGNLQYSININKFSPEVESSFGIKIDYGSYNNDYKIIKEGYRLDSNGNMYSAPTQIVGGIGQHGLIGSNSVGGYYVTYCANSGGCNANNYDFFNFSTNGVYPSELSVVPAGQSYQGWKTAPSGDNNNIQRLYFRESN